MEKQRLDNRYSWFKHGLDGDFHKRCQTSSIDIALNLSKKIDDKKDTGLDKIPSKVLKTAARIIAPLHTDIFYKSSLTGTYPSEWKTAKVTPVFKKGITSDPNNKGPITVIPIVSKVKDEMVYEMNQTNGGYEIK